MQKTNQKTNLFLTLLRSATKGVIACLVDLFLLSIIDNISKKKKMESKENLLKSGKAYSPSIEEKVNK